MDLIIKPFEKTDIESTKILTDKEIGQDYFSLEELREMQQRSQFESRTASFVLRSDQEVFGIRLSFPPGQWQKGKGAGLSENLWDHKKSETAYFQSLFISNKVQKQGWGKRLSEKSLKVLKEMGAKAVVCHSWVESPGEASKKYLLSLGFKGLALYPEYWKGVDYICPRCSKPCLCTAEEMYLDLAGSKS